MNKWLIRIFGVMILVIVGLFFFDNWFAPQVPPQLQQGLAAEHSANGEITLPQRRNPASPQETQDRITKDATAANPNAIHLTSLENAPGDNRDSLPQSTQVEKVVKDEQNPVLPAKRTELSDNVPAAPASVKAWVQAGSFGNRENAERRAEALKKLNMPVAIDDVTVNGKSYHRLYVGPLLQDQVESVLRVLSDSGIDARQISR